MGRWKPYIHPTKCLEGPSHCLRPVIVRFVALVSNVSATNKPGIILVSFPTQGRFLTFTAESTLSFLGKIIDHIWILDKEPSAVSSTNTPGATGTVQRCN